MNTELLAPDEAIRRVLSLIEPTDLEDVRLEAASGRALAAPVIASRAQPPFAASAMDGYAIRFEDAAEGAMLKVIGEAPAGRRFAGEVGAGEAVRIFTGAPMPEGADTVLIQENATREGETLRVDEAPRRARISAPTGWIFSPAQGLRRPGASPPMRSPSPRR